MKQNICTQCQKQVSAKATFCGNCGTQMRCLSCKEEIKKGFNFCENCGEEVKRKSSNEKSDAPNSIKFHENADGRTFEAEFTDPVGKEITETFGKILIANKQLSMGNNIPTGGSEQNHIQNENVQDAQEIAAEVIDPTPSTTNYPSLHSVSMKNLPANEAEWIVVYSFYASKFGKEVFTRKDIISQYEKTNRKTTSRLNSLTSYIKSVVKADNINPLNDNGDFTMLDSGISRAIEIINRTSGSSSKKSTSKANNKKSAGTKKSTVGQSLSLVQNLNLHPSGKQSLKDFFGQFDVKSYFEKNLIFIYYLEKILDEDERSLNHIYTCYKKAGERVPGNLYQSLADTKKSKGWIETKDMAKLSVSVTGENALEHDLKRK